jgi:His-Xaa-Ser system radical SAM maturase HxsB
MINFFNFKKFNDEFLITNDMGNYMFVSKEDLSQLIMDKISADNTIYGELVDKGFVYDTRVERNVEQHYNSVADNKDYLFVSTQLHIFVLTNQCNTSCVYCQAQSNMQHGVGKMTIETARKAVDIALSGNSNNLTFEFQGGEPLLNYDVIRFIIEYTEANKHHKYVEYNLVSNLTRLTNDMLNFFKEHNVRISTSIDGDKVLHNTNRPYVGGKGTYEDVKVKLKEVQKLDLSSGAIQTTTRYSLNKYKDIIDTYISLGLNSLFLRPLTPLGFALESWERIGYDYKDFLKFYKNSIEYIIEKNKEGIHFSEGHAGIFLAHILEKRPINYMELRSPCGAGIGQMAYYYDGKIFTCDEGRMFYEMGHDDFQLGTVDNTYNELIDNPICWSVATASTLESIPGCCDCAYQPFCGTCPILNLAFDKNIFPTRPNDYKCGIYAGMLNVIFSILQKGNKEDIQILRSWAN